MRNEDDQASTTPVRTAALGSHPAEPIGWSTPLRFDPDLVRELLSQHDRLDRLLDTLPSRCERARERDAALQTAGECADRLHALRRQEALWIYPLMARHFDDDPLARRRLLNLRFVMNGLARCVLRRFEELTRAIRQAGDIRPAVAAAIAALAAYRQRNEAELYTLYGLADPRRRAAAAQAK